MSKKKSLVVDQDKYLNFIAGSPLVERLASDWFDEEILARALLNVLYRNKLIDYHEVNAEFDRLVKTRISNDFLYELEQEEIPLSVDFSIPQETLNQKTRIVTCEVAYQELTARILRLIPRALIVKYKDEPIDNQWDSPEISTLCKDIANQNSLDDMFDIFIAADQHLQKSLVVKTFAFTQYLYLLYVTQDKNHKIEVPDSLLSAIRFFLVGDWDSLKIIND